MFQTVMQNPTIINELDILCIRCKEIGSWLTIPLRIISHYNLINLDHSLTTDSILDELVDSCLTRTATMIALK